MADFQNTIDLFGDHFTVQKIIDRSIEEYNDDSIAKIGAYAFSRCTSLTSVNIPNVMSIGESAFQGCSALTSVNIPNVTSIGETAFQGCSMLTSIDLPSVTTINFSAFSYSYRLNIIIIRSNNVALLTTSSTFNSTPFASGKGGGKLLIPRDLVESYKTTGNWSVIWGYGHNQFLALEDYTVDGTTTGEIDWDKLNGGTAA